MESIDTVAKRRQGTSGRRRLRFDVLVAMRTPGSAESEAKSGALCAEKQRTLGRVVGRADEEFALIIATWFVASEPMLPACRLSTDRFVRSISPTPSCTIRHNGFSANDV
ncbi:hypothetical protein Y032_0146g2540 [Ancylostoma ceylanicum]|uniref:Uncharacterized protein n=1 Tax=Ancylostoma ceylanicum TaxID=53326 RepID=A0A016T1I1_9BILA|nr:hypothetical protein Y032_0146g2540 [Ancylostoma ceylanicum]